METFLIKTTQLILSLSILVLMHELGHFIFAKIFKTRVEKFYLFFNPRFSIFRMKKINKKWHFKWFSQNDTNIRLRYNYEKKVVEEIIPAEQLPDTNWKKYPDTTEWGIGWLPLGGYCKVAGMIDESLDTEQMKKPAQSWEFRSKPAWQRLLIMIGGVAVNFVLALAIYSATLFTWGNTYMEMRETPMQFSETAQSLGFRNGDCLVSADGKALGRFSESALLAALEAKTITILRNDTEIALPMPEGGLIRLAMKDQSGLMSPYMPAVVDSVASNTPAAALLQKGDRFIKVENETITSFYDLKTFLDNNTKTILSAVLLRNNDTVSLVIPLNENGLIGFTPQQNFVRHKETFSFWQSIPAGIDYGVNTLISYVRQMKYVFTREGAQQIGGFASIGGLFPAKWNWQAFWEMTAFLSVILAFMNFLPIPALDGGHVLFILYEVITRRKPSTNFMMRAQLFGMAILFALLIYANGNDLMRYLFK